MSKGVKWGLGILLTIFLSGAIAWANRLDIMLGLIEIVSSRRTQVGPNLPVEWATGVDPMTCLRAD